MNSSECLRVLIPSQVTLLMVVVGLFLPASLDHVMAHVSSAHRLFPLSPGFSRVRARGCALRWAPYPTTAPWPPGTSLMPALLGEEQGVVTVLQAAGFAGSRPVWWRRARLCSFACQAFLARSADLAVVGFVICTCSISKMETAAQICTI